MTRNFDDNGLINKLSNNLFKTFKDQIPPGGFRGAIDFKYGPYKLYAFAGKNIIDDNARSEHLPYHCHIMQKGKTIYRIEICEAGMKELDEKKIPKNLKKYILSNSNEIERRVRETFHAGDWERKVA